MSASVVIVCPACASANRVPAARIAQEPICGKCGRTLFDGHPVALDDNSFDRFVTRNEVPVVVDFWAPWCGPCRAFAPTYEQAATRLEPHVRLAKLDTEANPGIAQRHAIRSIPTLAIFRDGRELVRVSGAMPLAAFLEWVANSIGSRTP